MEQMLELMLKMVLEQVIVYYFGNNIDYWGNNYHFGPCNYRHTMDYHLQQNNLDKYLHCNMNLVRFVSHPVWVHRLMMMMGVEITPVLREPALGQMKVFLRLVLVQRQML
jgi:hypothetical protein